jgi:hypothetical protein
MRQTFFENFFFSKPVAAKRSRKQFLMLPLGLMDKKKADLMGLKRCKN